MIDTTTLVSTDSGAAPYIVVPVSLLDKVTSQLDAYKVAYRVEEEALSLVGGPEATVINLGYQCDPVAIQRFLDSIP